MSHFTVAVITTGEYAPNEEEISNLLEPYDENIEVEPYVEMTFDEVKENLRNRSEEYFRNTKAKGAEPDINTVKLYKSIMNALDTNNDDEIKRLAKEYYGEDSIDDNGNYVSTYNPMSKWDWWEIGGRWADYMSEHAAAVDGESAQVKDILIRVHDDGEETLANKFPDDYKYWKTIKNGTAKAFYKVEYLQSLYPTFYDYVKANNDFYTHAVVTPDGKWHEAGQMGWFGCSSESAEESTKWANDFYKNFLENRNPNDWVTIVDCHI